MRDKPFIFHHLIGDGRASRRIREHTKPHSKRHQISRERICLAVFHELRRMLFVGC
jgi:hypothetical protein